MVAKPHIAPLASRQNCNRYPITAEHRACLDAACAPAHFVGTAAACPYNRRMNTATKKKGSATIALNRRARHDYHFEDKFEAGLVLKGWEVKSLREGKVQLTDSYILIRDGEAWLIGANIHPLSTASTHFIADPTRTRKLLLNQRELGRVIGAVQKKGYTCVATALYWKNHLVKCEIALAKGKAEHDKRDTEKERDWQRQKQRLARIASR